MSKAFRSKQIICTELGSPRQMLANQAYEGHVSIHDDVMADELGFQAGPIEGPTHFSQVTPLAHRIFGDAFFESGCISAHYKNMVVEGEQVRAFAEIPEEGSTITRAWAEKSDGSLVEQSWSPPKH